MDEKSAKLFYIDKNYRAISELLKNNSDIQSFMILAKINLWSGNPQEAYKYFKKAQYLLGCGYCKFLSGEIEEAYTIINFMQKSSSAANWLYCLINLIIGKDVQMPAYFQIRNFYEQDLEMLFFYKQKEYADKILLNLPFFEKSNKEIYKYTGRVMLNRNFSDYAEKFLKKSLDICYQDPETHFMLGELYLKKKDYKKAKQEYLLAGQANGEYLPAKNKLLQIIV